MIAKSVFKLLAPADTLLLVDRGSTLLKPVGWDAKVCPQLMLLSVAASDRQGLPSPETLEALQGMSLLRTDRDG